MLLLGLGRLEWFTRVVWCTIYATLFLLRSYFGTIYWYLHGTGTIYATLFLLRYYFGTIYWYLHGQGSDSGHAVIYTGRYLLW